MAYENRNAAYDLSLFDEDVAYSNGSALPKRKEQEVHKKQTKKKTKTAGKVVTIPEEEIHKIRRRKHNPLKLALGSIGGAAVAVVIGFIIVGQVQLTELNQEIITAKSLLADSQSIYTQNQMKVESKLSNAEIEEYAENVLGMTKASNAQKEFVTLSGGDKAEVSAQESDNLFTQFIDSIKNLWS
ncbi:hypothetical protein [uncultured Ruminococcus sp.]|uniref:hypothetical protein n=1 Tax=uncultured Ruminococcus sp. TaxID=165186 RepID=UPI0025D6E028|nr:hypothetical protein [uncultured Ruminococcus sp.]